LPRRERLAYLAGLFDGEGCLTASIERDKRKGGLSETDGWRITFCVQFTNSDDGLVGEASRLLETLGYHPRIQKYANGSSHVRMFRQEEVRRFCQEVLPLSRGSKKSQIKIFLDKIVPLMALRPELSEHNHERIWTRQLFIQTIEAIDLMNTFKRRRLSRRKYDRAFFANLWLQS
jgi:hypothetical protein